MEKNQPLWKILAWIMQQGSMKSQTHTRKQKIPFRTQLGSVCPFDPWHCVDAKPTQTKMFLWRLHNPVQCEHLSLLSLSLSSHLHFSLSLASPSCSFSSIGSISQGQCKVEAWFYPPPPPVFYFNAVQEEMIGQIGREEKCNLITETEQ